MKDNNNECKSSYWPFLAIVGVVAIVAVVMLVMNNESSTKRDYETAIVGEGARAPQLSTYLPDGRSQSTDPETGITYTTAGCNDADGRNYNSKGSTTYKTLVSYPNQKKPVYMDWTGQDWCITTISKTMLGEFVCFDQWGGNNIAYDCAEENKVCLGGRCVPKR